MIGVKEEKRWLSKNSRLGLLRMVRVIPVPRGVEDVDNEVMATVDLIDTSVNLLFFDCKLFLLQELGEA
jgi:hypothetical protein